MIGENGISERVPPSATAAEPGGWGRLFQAAAKRWWPFLGWAALALLALLGSLPAWAIETHDWVHVARYQVNLALSGPLAVLASWCVWGWRRPFVDGARSRGRAAWRIWLGRSGRILLLLAVGAFLLSALFVGWLPTPAELWQTARHGSWQTMGGQATDEFRSAGLRFSLWWQGVRSGGAAQDDFVFSIFAAAILWLAGLLSAGLARQTWQGLLAALPPLWLTGAILIFSNEGRLLMVGAVALALLLQLVVHQESLTVRWRQRGFDYSPFVIVDRLVNAVLVLALVLFVAALMPNLYISPLAWAYYDLAKPFNERLEAVKDRLFPDLRGVGRFGRGVAGGMPNDFLLGSGGELGQAELMRVRTSEAPAASAPPFYAETPAPPGRYLRAVTYATYDGRGWGNDVLLNGASVRANRPWQPLAWEGRKEVVQSIVTTFNAAVYYAAGEALEVAEDYRAEWRGDGDLVGLFGRDRSYTITSLVPAVDVETLAAEPPWQTTALPAGYEEHLALPPTVTERTRELAAELTAGLSSPYAKVHAIERALRSYPYDLDVPELPAEVTDVADYFLFDLQRGYCDYYATAFVVLARLAGLPTRFATGFAIGQWDGAAGAWIITEAEAHSWPEVYFPDYGWIPFEPTAGRPELERVGQAPGSSGAAPAFVLPAEAEAPDGIAWNWQMIFWLLPAALLVWGGVALVRGWRDRQDPWEALLRWGRRSGRPMQEGETALEYGAGLGEFVLGRGRREPESGRIAAREVTAMSREVTTARYGPLSARERALAEAGRRWQRLRGTLQRLR